MSGDGPACRTALALLACALLALPMLVVLPPISRAAPPDYPTRPPPAYPPRPGEPTATPAHAEVTGAMIELRARFDPGWVWAEIPWEEMDTLVQWQDGWGGWHDVESWRGALDEVRGREGRKSWWVSDADLGTGPFRWVLYRRRGGEVLGTGQAFDMPPGRGQVVRSVLQIPAPAPVP